MNVNNGGFRFLRLTWKIYLILSQLSCDVSHPSPPSKNSYPVYTDYFSDSQGRKEVVVAFANGAAAFDCVVILNATGRNLTVHWTKDRADIDDIIGLNSRCQLSQEPIKNGTKKYSLTIVNVTVEDEGEFGCYLLFSKPEGETFTPVRIDAWPARLRVDINATEPRVVPASPVKSRIGQFVVLTCRTSGRPCPMISWYDGDNQEIVEEVTNTTAYVSPLFDVESQLSFKVEDHNPKMKCLRCVVRGRSFSAATQKMIPEMKEDIRIQTPEYPLGYQCYFDAGSTISTTSERIDSNSQISTISKRTDSDSEISTKSERSDPDLGISTTSERAGPESAVSATSGRTYSDPAIPTSSKQTYSDSAISTTLERTNPDATIPTTSERSHQDSGISATLERTNPDTTISTTSEQTVPDSEISTTSDLSDPDSGISITSEQAGPDSAVSATSEPTNPDSTISATSEQTNPDTTISTTSERTNPDTTFSSSSERTDADPAISTSSEWPKDPAISIGDGLNLVIGIGGTGLLVVLVLTPLLVWYCVMYRHQGSYNVTEQYAHSI